MRYDVKKFLIIGAQEDRERFFKKAQEVGIVHFIDISSERIKETSPEIHDITAAIKVLRGLPTVEQQEMDDYSRGNEIAKRILSLKHEIEKFHEEIRVLNLEISRIEIFGYFNLQDVSYIEKEGKCTIQYFCAKRSALEEKEIQDSLIYIGSDHDLDYFIAINKEPKIYESMVEMHIERSLSELKHSLQDAEKNLHLREKDLKSLAKYNSFLHHALVYKLNSENLFTTQKFAQPMLEGTLFAVEGWVPEHKAGILKTLGDDLHIHCEEIAIEPTDSIPTYLENEGMGKVGEDLIHIYDVPSHKDKDPSLWVLFAFSLFFAMIVGDAGYGLVFLGAALFLRYRFPGLKGVKKRLLSLFTLLCFTCIAWGMLTNSFFGITLSMENPLRKVSLLQWMVEKQIAYHMKHQDAVYQDWTKKFPQIQGVTDPHEFIKVLEASHDDKSAVGFYDTMARYIMFELALFVGVIHISLSFMRYLGRNWSGFGWLIFIVGAYLYLPFFLKATSLIHYIFGVEKEWGGSVGSHLMLVGFIVALALAVLKDKWLGFVEIMIVVQIFADVLSYLRIYALGIAGATVSGVINEMAGPLPLVFAVILLGISHIINMLLGVMGGIIHGLRLNFLEWYHYSFEGRGKLFNPLRMLEIEK